MKKAQREMAKALGVHPSTVNRDLKEDVANATNEDEEPPLEANTEDIEEEDVANATNPLFTEDPAETNEKA